VATFPLILLVVILATPLLWAIEITDIYDRASIIDRIFWKNFKEEK